MTLVKENLIQSLYDQAGLSKQQSKALVDNVFELIKKSLESSDDVLISGFGKFSVRSKAPRRGRNPSTREDLTLDARRVVMFKWSRLLRDKINGAG
jgi:integration host factor subunit alpha